jgi:hypothetical protein
MAPRTFAQIRAARRRLGVAGRANPGLGPRRRYSGLVTSPNAPRPQPVDYKGEPLDAARGPGLGCFWLQMIVLVGSIILTPLTVNWGWPTWITMVSFVVTILLLLLTGQTMIFLLRIVAASRTDGRRRPLASTTPTVGELEDTLPEGEAPGEKSDDAFGDDAPGVRQ